MYRVDEAICKECGDCVEVCPAIPREAASLAHRPEIEVMAVDHPRSGLWPMVGNALVWAARELLPQVTTAWRAAHAEVSPPISGKPTASNRRTPISWRNGHRHRWGRA